jgi:hypothetical protein
MLAEGLLHHTSTALRAAAIDNDFLEQLTETDARFDRWRARSIAASLIDVL